jgi:acetyl esterase/lipase
MLLALLALLAQGQQPPLMIPSTVEVKKDIVYARYGAREMRLDLFLPKTHTGAMPAVVYVHGGGWSGGNKGAFARHAAHMATLGFVGACVEYRLSGEAKYPAAWEDVQNAVRWVRQHAKEYNVDPGRIGAAGGSAGGHLVGLLGTKGRGDAAVQAVAAFNPAVDLVDIGQRAPAAASVVKFLGASYAENPKLWREASPVEHVSKQSPPFLFLHGTKDMTVPYAQSVTMMEKLKAAGVRAEIFTAEDAGHTFFNRPPWFEPTLKRMAEFFVSTLGTKGN